MALAPGDPIYVRHFQRERLSAVYRCQVVSDEPDGLVAWGPPGSSYRLTHMADGRALPETPLREWVAGPHVWVERPGKMQVLLWHPAGRDWSVRWFFRPDGEFLGWYGNLERPGARWRSPTLSGLDTTDWDLDVWVHPDRRWEWKDADLFRDRLTEPDVYWVDDEARVRRAGAEVIALVEAGAFPFDGTWCDFRPDPAWPPIPIEYPDGWDRPPAFG